MPAVVIERPPPPRTENMWNALKIHIQRERQKKKQEQEADAEVERQRKERERQQKLDVMTLGETREQISQLEQRLAQLKEEKHQLFLQLKKVLNEDDNRRRQLVKESNEVLEMYGVTLGGNPQLFLQQNIPIANRNPLYKVPPTHTLLPPGALKRPCSPSPPPPAANYHQNYGYKPGQAAISTYQKVATEDNRRGHEYVRAVLWNKNTQYSPLYPSSTTISYSASASPSNVQTVYTYAGPQFAQPSGAATLPPPPSREAPPPMPQDSQSGNKHPVYMGQQRPPISQGFLHTSVEHSKAGFTEDKFYSVAPMRPATHVSLHGGAIPIQQPPQSIQSGYVSQAPQSAASRLVYSQAGIPPPPTAPPGRYAPMSNMQREV
ncbi:uncharacterized protein LOC142325140 isoform X2 [Lycorma delicatula]|uniref:uncharacterized protein LOC142325140 isoform X2 n=1 Tax=Lycorma delicatula TaxID=130591 RepID=UPI003F518DD0